jgi:hypothetical protein
MLQKKKLAYLLLPKFYGRHLLHVFELNFYVGSQNFEKTFVDIKLSTPH